MNTLKKVLAGLLVAIVAAAGILLWLGYRDYPTSAEQAAPAMDAGALVEKGRYLASVGNCMGCHTATGGKPFAGGRELPTQFGSFFGPNLTSDAATGIGQWTADDFWRALHNGKARDGSLLYPAFPYASYSSVSRADSDALYAYLHSLPAVSQQNRPHDLDFPFSQRIVIAGWRALYFHPRQPVPASDKSPQWLRGRYLVEGLAHCAECHTPRNGMGALVASKGLQGESIPAQNWYAPPLTGDRITGLGQWSEQDVVDLLKTGISRHAHAAGPMSEAVRVGFQHASDDDLHSIAIYLKSLPAAGLDADARGQAAETGVMESGGKLYTAHCVQCHQASGEGKAPAWPSLAGNISVVASSPSNVIRAVLSGGFAPATEGNPEPHGMPPFGQRLNDQEVAAVATYVRQSWGNSAETVTFAQVRRVREAIR
jgi:mono/diheme cytochrome c family protein